MPSTPPPTPNFFPTPAESLYHTNQKFFIMSKKWPRNGKKLKIILMNIIKSLILQPHCGYVPNQETATNLFVNKVTTENIIINKQLV